MLCPSATEAADKSPELAQSALCFRHILISILQRLAAAFYLLSLSLKALQYAVA